MYKLTLTCSNIVYIDFQLRLQYPKDEHWVLCPDCQFNKHRDPYGRPPTAWQKVLDNVEVSDVPSGTTVLMPDRVMRIQPLVPANRVRPFPYVAVRKGFRVKP